MAESAQVHAIPLIKNVVTTAQLGCELVLKEIAHHALNAEYNARRNAVLMTIRRPRAKALFYECGKMICWGTTSVTRSNLAGRKFVRIIQMLGFPAKFTQFHVVNVIARYDVDFSINLTALALQHKECSSYEPELYPALSYRVQQPSVNVLIFASGKLVFHATRSHRDMCQAFVHIAPILDAFRKA